jgi:mRNA-degrading endonuclease toxin of MazEF toxin-antitoxin module
MPQQWHHPHPAVVITRDAANEGVSKGMPWIAYHVVDCIFDIILAVCVVIGAGSEPAPNEPTSLDIACSRIRLNSSCHVCCEHTTEADFQDEQHDVALNTVWRTA